MLSRKAFTLIELVLVIDTNAFFDGHVETTKLPNLWTLKWAVGWSRTTPALVPAK